MESTNINLKYINPLNFTLEWKDKEHPYLKYNNKYPKFYHKFIPSELEIILNNKYNKIFKDNQTVCYNINKDILKHLEKLLKKNSKYNNCILEPDIKKTLLLKYNTAKENIIKVKKIDYDLEKTIEYIPLVEIDKEYFNSELNEVLLSPFLWLYEYKKPYDSESDSESNFERKTLYKFGIDWYINKTTINLKKNCIKLKNINVSINNLTLNNKIDTELYSTHSIFYKYNKLLKSFNYSTPFLQLNYFKYKQTFINEFYEKEKNKLLSKIKIQLPSNKDNIFLSKLELLDKFVIEYLQLEYFNFKPYLKSEYDTEDIKSKYYGFITKIKDWKLNNTFINQMIGNINIIDNKIKCKIKTYEYSKKELVTRNINTIEELIELIKYKKDFPLWIRYYINPYIWYNSNLNIGGVKNYIIQMDICRAKHNPNFWLINKENNNNNITTNNNENMLISI